MIEKLRVMYPELDSMADQDLISNWQNFADLDPKRGNDVYETCQFLSYVLNLVDSKSVTPADVLSDGALESLRQTSESLSEKGFKSC